MRLQSFDALHSVSDLHLGGAPGRQIFHGTPALAGLIRRLKDDPSSGRLALVLNGDIVDFLAAPDAQAFDADGAIKKLDEIRAAESFAPIFAALAAFVATPGRTLVLVLGNHDLELALPDVREAFVTALAGTDHAARGRIQVCLDGEGFTAQVGSKRVLCIHGNDVDSWNATDYEHLRQIARDRQFGKTVDPWVPNAGSKMVIEVMNGIKRDHPFVDLLKPETSAVVPVLLALDQASASRLRAAAGVATRLGWDSVRRTFGFLSVEDDANGPVEDPLAPILRRGFPSLSTSDQAHARLIEQVERQILDGTDPLDLSGDGELGWGGAILNLFRGKPKSEVLRQALQGLKDDPDAWKLLPGKPEKDATFTALDDLIDPQVDVLIAGHTHLERRIPRRRGSGLYLNTGTWAWLMRIADQVLDDSDAFAKAFAVFGSDRMDTLTGSGMALHRPAVASVWNEAGATHADLRRVVVQADGRVTFDPINE